MYKYVVELVNEIYSCNPLTTGLDEVLSQFERLWLHPVKQVRVVDTLAQLGQDIHQTCLTASLAKRSFGGQQ